MRKRMLSKVASFYISYILLFVCCTKVIARRHTLKIKNDARESVTCSKFGFLKDGYLFINVEKFQSDIEFIKTNGITIGFTLDKASTTGTSSYWEKKMGKCVFKNDVLNSAMASVYFSLNFKNNRVEIKRVGSGLDHLYIGNINETDFLSFEKFRKLNPLSTKAETLTSPANYLQYIKDQLLNQFDYSKHVIVSDLVNSLKKANVTLLKQLASANSATSLISSLKLWHTNGSLSFTKDAQELLNSAPKLRSNILDNNIFNGSVDLKYNAALDFYSFHFLIAVLTSEEQGFYNLYFHNCPESQVMQAKVNITLSIVEKNALSYLSAGEQPLPFVYFAFCGFYFALSCIWFYFLKTTVEPVYRMHYVMLLLIVVKTLALVFHGINYYVLGKQGIHEEGWAVMYYITHLMKGALLFITIILVGTGWTFIKHMLSSREKKLFIVIIPLQILANVATIIVEESEEGNVNYTTWKEIFILVDLLCCGAILFPVVWSIRHLQDASQTDGKAAANLTRLRLFRQFYILIVCYIYFTRIIVYLLNITVPFQWTWIVELFREIATYVFFVVTGVKFRPVSQNPYLRLPVEEDEDNDEENILMDRLQSGATDGVVKLKRRNEIENEDSGTTRENAPTDRESSHAYD